jgi:hypothetical protein
MNNWFKFLRSIESEGGSVLILILLIIMFAAFVKLGFKDAESQLYFILGALVGLLKGKGGNSESNETELTVKKK